MTLEKLIIEDFQCHAKQVIKLDPGITVFTGPSDSGKSAIIRSLKWLMTNQPSGEAFIKQGTTGSRVRLAVDSSKVTRSRSAGANIYKLDGREFRSFNTGVPDDISSLLNVRPENFSGQHDSAFWLTLSPGQVSKELNAVVNLDGIDRTLAYIASEVRKAKATEEVSRDRLKQAKQEVESLSFVPDMLEAFGKIEKLQAEASASRLKSTRIDSLVTAEESAREGIWKASEEVLALVNVVTLVGEAVVSKKRRDRLDKLIDDMEEDTDRKDQLRAGIANIEMEIADKTKGRCPICKGKLK